MKEFIKGANPYMPLWEHVPDGEPSKTRWKQSWDLIPEYLWTMMEGYMPTGADVRHPAILRRWKRTWRTYFLD